MSARAREAIQHNAEMLYHWNRLMTRVQDARERGAGVLMSPQEVEMMFLSFDGFDRTPRRPLPRPSGE